MTIETVFKMPKLLTKVKKEPPRTYTRYDLVPFRDVPRGGRFSFNLSQLPFAKTDDTKCKPDVMVFLEVEVIRK